MITIIFIEQQAAIDPRLTLRAELLDDKGARFWVAFGSNKTTLFEKAVGWLDDCHGRCGHTPTIHVGKWARELSGNAGWIQHEVQARQAARIGKH